MLVVSCKTRDFLFWKVLAVEVEASKGVYEVSNLTLVIRSSTLTLTVSWE